MIEDQPSQTAHRVAQHRAGHQLWDHPRVFEDPLALRIIPDAAELSHVQPEAKPAERSLRAFVAARSRYTEDQLAEAVRRGVKQYVVLGAGLDTFAYRNSLNGLHVFEVDYPATQAWKRQRLASAGISLPGSLTFVPVDFEKQTLAGGLANAGFASSQPAFFSWLGVTVYLARPTVMETFSWLISICPRNGVVFDYAVPRSLLTPAGEAAFDELASRVAAAGEPFVTFFDPQELATELKKRGFNHIEDLGAKEINVRYFHERADELRVRGGARVMCARG